MNWAETAATDPFIRISGLVKSFDGVRAVDDVSLNIAKGELFCLLGGSGSGKSTLLRMLAGFETPDEGVLEIEGIDMRGVDPAHRPINMMFQSYALFPHMTVEANIAYGLKQQGIAGPDRAQQVEEMLRLVRMESYGRRKPHQLSGGQRQRVALARALARKPKVLLLDEPLSALDRKLREETQFELMDIQDKLGTTFIVVTHDQEEAMTLATRIGVMDKGKLVQVDTPRRIYEFPQTKFIADFVGNINLLEAKVEGKSEVDGHVVLECPDLGRIEAVCEDPDIATGQSCWVAIRPEKITFTKADAANQLPVRKHVEATRPRLWSRLPFGRAKAQDKVEPPRPALASYGATIDDLAYRGGVTQYRLRLPSGAMLTVTQPNQDRADARPFEWEDQVRFTFAPEGALVLRG